MEKTQELQETYQQARDIEERLAIINEQIMELGSFEKTLEDLEASNEKEILAPLGKGVYVKAELKEKELFVGVGAGIFVKKKVSETKKIVQQQSKKLSELKIGLSSEGSVLNEQLRELIEESGSE